MYGSAAKQQSFLTPPSPAEPVNWGSRPLPPMSSPDIIIGWGWFVHKVKQNYFRMFLISCNWLLWPSEASGTYYVLNIILCCLYEQYPNYRLSKVNARRIKRDSNNRLYVGLLLCALYPLSPKNNVIFDGYELHCTLLLT